MTISFVQSYVFYFITAMILILISINFKFVVFRQNLIILYVPHECFA